MSSITANHPFSVGGHAGRQRIKQHMALRRALAGMGFSHHVHTLVIAGQSLHGSRLTANDDSNGSGHWLTPATGDSAWRLGRK